MRAAAQIDKVPLAVEADLLALGQIGNDLGLVNLAPVLEKLDRLVALPDLAPDGLVALYDLAHPLLDFGKVVLGKRLGPGEIIIKTVFNHRADGDLDLRPQFLDRFGHDVRAIVAQQLQALFIF